MAKEVGEIRDDKLINSINLIILVVSAFAVSPFVYMFVWNTLATYLFNVNTIGYGGAWALMTLRMLLPTTYSPEDISSEESLARTFQKLFNSGGIIVTTIIVGYLVGAL